MALTTNPTTAITETLGEHPGSTAAELADLALIGRSTASKCLATMEHDGIARRTPGGHEGGRRTADRWSLVVSEPAAPQVPTAEPDPVGNDATDDPETTDEGAVDSEPEERADASGDAGDADVAAPGEPESVASDRLGKGALGSLVLDYLVANPGEHGPVAVAKALGGKSSGAVGNCLIRLVNTGKARCTSEKPRRYEAVR